MKYYKIIDDLDVPKKWVLGNVNFVNEGDFWRYIRAGKVDVPNYELSVNIRKQGSKVDFNLADFELFIVNEKVKNLIQTDDVQFIPVNVFNEEEKYFILALNVEIDCVDEEHSNFDKWLDNDPIRPDKAGQYKTFYKLILDYKKADNKDLFRVKKFNSIAVISERLKSIFEKNSVTGIKYKLVTY